MRLLIVEDEEEIQTYLKEELQSEYRIMTCKNGKEAYSIILADTPDLVISDIMMPEMDGMTLCRKIKQNANVNHGRQYSSGAIESYTEEADGSLPNERGEKGDVDFFV